MKAQCPTGPGSLRVSEAFTENVSIIEVLSRAVHQVRVT